MMEYIHKHNNIEAFIIIRNGKTVKQFHPDVGFWSQYYIDAFNIQIRFLTLNQYIDIAVTASDIEQFTFFRQTYS